MTNPQLYFSLMLCASVMMCSVQMPDAINEKHKNNVASKQERIAVMERTCSYRKPGQNIPTIRRDNPTCEEFAREITRQADKQEMAFKQ